MLEKGVVAHFSPTGN